jgi:hypothetical protein
MAAHTPQPAASRELGYAPAPQWPPSRLVRRFVLPLAALALVFASWWWGRPLASHLDQIALQRRCLSYVPPQPVQVIYDDDPAAVPGLLASPRYTGSHPAIPKAAGTVAVAGNAAYSAYRLSNGRTLPPAVFLGSRISPGGNVRLAAVTLSLVPAKPGPEAPFAQLVLHPGVELPRRLFSTAGVSVGGATRVGGALGLEMFVSPGDRTRLNEGRPDPADPSHFTIGYVHNGAAGTIDGWLNDDDTITLGPRAGDVVEYDATYHWWSPAPGAMPAYVYVEGIYSTRPRDASIRKVLPKRDDPRYKN